MIAALIVTMLSLPTSAAQLPQPDVPPEHWQVESGSRMAVHIPTQLGFPLVLDDFELVECQNLIDSSRSAGASYASSRKGGVRVLLLLYHRADLGEKSADETSKMLIAQQAMEIAKKSGKPANTSGGISFDVTISGKTVPAFTTIEAPSDPKSDENCLWLSLAYGDYVLFSGTKYHGAGLNGIQAAQIVADILPHLKWPALENSELTKP